MLSFAPNTLRVFKYPKLPNPNDTPAAEWEIFLRKVRLVHFVESIASFFQCMKSYNFKIPISFCLTCPNTFAAHRSVPGQWLNILGAKKDFCILQDPIHDHRVPRVQGSDIHCIAIFLFES